MSVILPLPCPSWLWAPSPSTATPSDKPSRTDSTGITPPQGGGATDLDGPGSPRGRIQHPRRRGRQGLQGLCPPPRTVPTACSVGAVPPEVPLSPVPTTCPRRPARSRSGGLEGVGPRRGGWQPAFPFHIKGDRVPLTQPRHSRKKRKTNETSLENKMRMKRFHLHVKGKSPWEAAPHYSCHLS